MPRLQAPRACHGMRPPTACSLHPSTCLQVSFSLLIPAMLFIRVTQIIASQPSPSILLTVSAFTLFQIGAGALMAKALAPLVERWSRGWDRAEDGSSGSAESSGECAGSQRACFVLCGVQQPSNDASRLNQCRCHLPSIAGLSSICTLACSFGSTFTLPVVFLSNMLPGAAADRALGYLALVLLAWSPLLWSVGPAIVKAAGSSSSSSPAAQRPQRSALAASPAAAAARLRAFVRQVATPPFVAVLCGAVAGATPLGRALVAPTGAAAAQLLGPIGGGLLRCVFDVVKMLASGALAGQSVVLAASLLQQPAQPAEPANSSSSGDGSSDEQQQRASSSGGGGLIAAAGQLLLPSSAVEARVLTVVALTRFLLLPALMLGGVWGLQRARLMPAAVMADPVLLLVLLAGSCMPSAQVSVHHRGVGGMGGRPAGAAVCMYGALLPCINLHANLHAILHANFHADDAKLTWSAHPTLPHLTRPSLCLTPSLPSYRTSSSSCLSSPKRSPWRPCWPACCSSCTPMQRCRCRCGSQASRPGWAYRWSCDCVSARSCCQP